MKYQARKLKSTGQFAVFQGSKYFTNTLTDNELKAKQQALIKSLQWYDSMKWQAWEELKEICELDEYKEQVKPIDQDHFAQLGDYLC